METTKTDNELIAEFMGFVMHQSETYGFILQHPDLMGTYQDHTRQNQHGKAMELKYHTSWDWLMPVCKKWDELPLLDNSQYVALSQKLDDEVSCYEIEPAYRQLVYNLKWYQNQQTVTPKE